MIQQTPDIPAMLEREIRKHLPEGYLVQAGREEAHAGYVVNIWREDPKKDVQGLEDVVCRCRLGGPQDNAAGGWRVVLLTRLWQDLESRRLGVKLLHMESGMTLIESDKPPTPELVQHLVEPQRIWRKTTNRAASRPFIDPRRRGYW